MLCECPTLNQWWKKVLKGHHMHGLIKCDQCLEKIFQFSRFEMTASLPCHRQMASKMESGTFINELLEKSMLNQVGIKAALGIFIHISVLI